MKYNKYILFLILILFILMIKVNNNKIESEIEKNNIENTHPDEESEEKDNVDLDEKYIIDNAKKYIGVYINDPKEINVYKNSLNVIGWFDTFDDPSYTKIKMCLDDHLYTAFITLEPSNMTLDDIISGVHDEIIIKYLKNLSEGTRANTELFIRFAHEMEMRPTYGYNWYEWQGNDSDLYINAWKHVVDLAKEYAPNVKWVWSPNRADEYTIKYYPGDEYVDYVSLTLNNLDKYETFKDFYEEEGRKVFLESYNKPIIFGEVAEHSLNEDIKNKYLISIFEYFKEYDNAIGIVFYDKNINKERQYNFSNNKICLENFIKNAKEIKYQRTRLDS